VLAALLALALTAPSQTALAQGDASGSQDLPKKDSPITVPNPGTNLWKGLRQANEGRSQVPGLESGVLINSAGSDWRKLRMGPLTRYGGWALFTVALLVLAYHVFHGPIRLESGRSGRVVPRWPLAMRVLHWYTAILFILHAITGLSLLFGRHVVIPLIGNEAFGSYAIAAKYAHNWLGPPLVVGVVLMAVLLIRDNLPSRVDIGWLLRGGGLFGSAHPSSGKLNFGEKALTYGVLVTVGLVACASGLVLAFPGFGQTRELMQQANLIHAATSVIWVFFIAGHIYLGTAGTEGTFEAMSRGYVDANWAKQHHDLWYDEVKDQEQPAPPDPAADRSIETGRTA
jgi:formate dehydrogenase subunit gamma